MTDDEWPEWPFERTEKRMSLPAVAAKTEPELLAAIDHQDHAARVVYADWLEEQGDSERAEWVRLQDRLLELPLGAERDAARNRAGRIACDLDPAWRVLVARVPIHNCQRADCPREWGSLAPTHTTDLRTCGACHAKIEYRFLHPDPNRTEPFVLDGRYDLGWPNPEYWDD